jgi:hypothetical protein
MDTNERTDEHGLFQPQMKLTQILYFPLRRERIGGVRLKQLAQWV